jgi:CheY-like chemotaxis protein
MISPGSTPPADATDRACDPAVEAAPPPDALRALVVEDQALIALALAADLAALGCEIVARAAGGEVAVALAGRHAPDLVLMDIDLAGDMDGIEAAARIQRACGARIVFVTAYAEGADRARMEAIRPVAILGKPYDPDELARAVHVCAARRWARRQALAGAGGAG